MNPDTRVIFAHMRTNKRCKEFTKKGTYNLTDKIAGLQRPVLWKYMCSVIPAARDTRAISNKAVLQSKPIYSGRLRKNKLRTTKCLFEFANWLATSSKITLIYQRGATLL